MALSQELRYRNGLQIGHEVPRRALGQESNGGLNSRRVAARIFSLSILHDHRFVYNRAPLAKGKYKSKSVNASR